VAWTALLPTNPRFHSEAQAERPKRRRAKKGVCMESQSKTPPTSRHAALIAFIYGGARLGRSWRPQDLVIKTDRTTPDETTEAKDASEK